MHSESEDWTKEEEEKKIKENEVPNDYYPPSPVYDPMFKQDPLPHLTTKKKLALDPNYYPKVYILEKEEETPLLVNNLIDPPEKNTSVDPQPKKKKGRKKRRQKTKKRRMEENQ